MGVAPTLVGIYNGLATCIFTHDFAMPKLQVRFFLEFRTNMYMVG